MKILDKNYFVFALLFLICGLYSVFVGVEATLELFLYHYWNGYSFITGRYLQDLDFAFCGVQTYFNPLFDAGFYLLSTYLKKFPDLFLFIQGFFPACGLFFLYKIVNLLVLKMPMKIFCSLFSLIFSMSTLLFFYHIGTSLIDLQLCFLPLAALFLFFKYVNLDNNNKTQLYSSFFIGMLFGFSVGFKLTFAAYFIAFILSVFFYRKNIWNPLFFVCLFLLGALSGYLIVNGYWAYFLWKTYGNPVFPFYNNIFNSDYTEALSYKAVDCLPATFLHWVAYPLFWYAKTSSYVIFMTFNNFFWAFAYCIFITYFISIKFIRNSKSIKYFSTLFDYSKINFLLVFLGLYYVIWIISFSVLRYAVLLDMFIGFIIFLFIMFFSYFVGKEIVSFILLLLLLFQLAHFSTYPTHTRRESSNILYYVEDKIIPDNSVVFAAGFPVSFAAVFQNPKCHYVYAFNNPNLEFKYTDKSKQIVDKWIEKNPDKIYALFGTYGFRDFLEDNVIWASSYKIDRNSCQIIYNNFIINVNEFIALCRINPEK